MRVYIDSKKIDPIKDHINVDFDYKGFTISAARYNDGMVIRTEVVIFPPDAQIVKDGYDIPALNQIYSNIPEAVYAVDKLADAVDLGIIKLEYKNDQ